MLPSSESCREIHRRNTLYVGACFVAVAQVGVKIVTSKFASLRSLGGDKTVYLTAFARFPNKRLIKKIRFRVPRCNINDTCLRGFVNMLSFFGLHQAAQCQRPYSTPATDVSVLVADRSGRALQHFLLLLHTSWGWICHFAPLFSNDPKTLWKTNTQICKTQPKIGKSWAALGQPSSQRLHVNCVFSGLSPCAAKMLAAITTPTCCEGLTSTALLKPVNYPRYFSGYYQGLL